MADPKNLFGELRALAAPAPAANEGDACASLRAALMSA
jgi:hypothetical protein